MSHYRALLLSLMGLALLSPTVFANDDASIEATRIERAQDRIERLDDDLSFFKSNKENEITSFNIKEKEEDTESAREIKSLLEQMEESVEDRRQRSNLSVYMSNLLDLLKKVNSEGEASMRDRISASLLDDVVDTILFLQEKQVLTSTAMARAAEVVVMIESGEENKEEESLDLSFFSDAAKEIELLRSAEKVCVSNLRLLRVQESLLLEDFEKLETDFAKIKKQHSSSDGTDATELRIQDFYKIAIKNRSAEIEAIRACRNIALAPETGAYDRAAKIDFSSHGPKEIKAVRELFEKSSSKAKKLLPEVPKTGVTP